MQKNGYGELMVKFVGNRWLYIDRDKNGEEILRDGDGNPLPRDTEAGTWDEGLPSPRSVAARHQFKRD